MNYTGEFREKAQIEMSKRLGFKNRTECIKSLGVKEFARKRDEFYKIYHNEIAESNIIDTGYVNELRCKTEFSKNLSDLLNYLQDNPDNTMRDLSKSFCFPYSYLSIMIKFGYLSYKLISRKPKYTIDLKGKSINNILTEIRVYSAEKQRIVRAREALMIEQGM